MASPRPLRSVARILLVLPLWLGPLVPQPIAAAEIRPPADWRRIDDGFGRGGSPRVLALGPGEDRAIGDAGGVSWWRDGVWTRAALSEVRDLAFTANGILWVATDEGLHRWSRDGRPERRRLGAGERAERISDLAVNGESLIVASEGGLFWSTTGALFQPLSLGGVAAPVSRVAIGRLREDRSAGGRIVPLRIWAAGPLGIETLRGLPADAGLRILSSGRLPAPLPGQPAPPVDLVFDADRRKLVAVYPEDLALYPIDAGEAAPPSAGWTRVRPARPPGARLRAVRPGIADVWLVSDRGLLLGSRLEGPFVRVAAAAGLVDCFDLVRHRDGPLHAACRSGTWIASAAASRPLEGKKKPRSAPSLAVTDGAARNLQRVEETASHGLHLPADPPLPELHRQALVHAGLEVSWTARLRRGLERRGLWPELELAFGADFDEDDRRDADQSFVSGDTRRLFDRTRDRGRHYEATLRLDWDLGEIVYPSDSVDLSRELRQIVSLRDDIADEINALYYERQRLREQLATGASSEPGAARRARWRARELDAGLDAWTGGFVTRWRQRQRLDDLYSPRSRSNRNP